MKTLFNDALFLVILMAATGCGERFQPGSTKVSVAPQAAVGSVPRPSTSLVDSTSIKANRPQFIPPPPAVHLVDTKVTIPVDTKVTIPVDTKVTSPVVTKVTSPVDTKVTSPVDTKVTSPVVTKVTSTADTKKSWVGAEFGIRPGSL